MNTSSKIDLKSAQDFSMMHIIKILPTLKAISASCDPIFMNLDLFWSSQYSPSGCFSLKFLQSLYHFLSSFKGSIIWKFSWRSCNKFQIKQKVNNHRRWYRKIKYTITNKKCCAWEQSPPQTAYSNWYIIWT
jgi:hypothetical protein